MRPAPRHLLGIEPLDAGAITSILDDAERFFAAKPDAHRDVLRGRTVVNAFFEASTRTRCSFEIAAKRLGADVVNVASAASSVTKGETLLDTAKNLEAMGVDVIVLRHPASGAPHFLAPRLTASLVNAGDGAHEHPTQALLDAFTIKKKKGGLAGLVVAICGDILHSRVARSNALLLGKLGAEVRLAGPRTLLPREASALGPTVVVAPRLEDAVTGADVVMMLRIQTERLAGAMISTGRDYARAFGLSPTRLALAKKDAIVLHPGPMNRGVEIDSRVADGPESVILEQVAAGVAVRSAVLAQLVSGTA